MQVERKFVVKSRPTKLTNMVYTDNNYAKMQYKTKVLNIQKMIKKKHVRNCSQITF